MITLRSVSKSFKTGHETITVLNAIDLTINKGEFVAIVGPSGSGKTTLTHIIGGLSKPDKGEVLINDTNIAKANDRELSRYRNKSVGFVFQNYSLLPHYTTLENVMIPLTLARVGRSAAEKRAAKYLELVGLKNQVRQQAYQLSGGQRQRVAIARALVNSPKLLIADEPTGSLDFKHGEEVAAILQRLNKEAGVTIVMVTHNLDLAKRAGRIIKLHNGKIR